jgi:hypothetical protein
MADPVVIHHKIIKSYIIVKAIFNVNEKHYSGKADCISEFITVICQCEHMIFGIVVEHKQ